MEKCIFCKKDNGSMDRFVEDGKAYFVCSECFNMALKKSGIEYIDNASA